MSIFVQDQGYTPSLPPSMKVMHRAVAGADCIISTRRNGFLDVGFRRPDRLADGQPPGQIRPDSRGEGTTGAMGVDGIDASASQPVKWQSRHRCAPPDNHHLAHH